jgi:hypothetical protein
MDSGDRACRGPASEVGADDMVEYRADAMDRVRSVKGLRERRDDMQRRWMRGNGVVLHHETGGDGTVSIRLCLVV